MDHEYAAWVGIILIVDGDSVRLLPGYLLTCLLADTYGGPIHVTTLPARTRINSRGHILSRLRDAFHTVLWTSIYCAASMYGNLVLVMYARWIR